MRLSGSRVVNKSAFTLVELLVVIGIIALLISILLPALNSARRSANAVKCSTSLREIGNAFQMYAIDSKGYFPPAKLSVRSALAPYDLYGTKFTGSGGDSTTSAYWINFLSKYVTKANVGNAITLAGGSGDAGYAQTRTLFWGCPSFEPYTVYASNVQTGYGYNDFPTWNPGSAAPSVANNEEVQITDWAINPRSFGGLWPKQKLYTKLGSERALVTDSRFFVAQSLAAPADKTFPPQCAVGNAVTYTSGVPGQTMVEVYRHGKFPPVGSIAGTFAQTGGKVAYNVLYADGHTATEVTQVAAYKAIRMRYPN